jgi:hypothetical protein
MKEFMIVRFLCITGAGGGKMIRYHQHDLVDAFQLC